MMRLYIYKVYLVSFSLAEESSSIARVRYGEKSSNHSQSMTCHKSLHSKQTNTRLRNFSEFASLPSLTSKGFGLSSHLHYSCDDHIMLLFISRDGTNYVIGHGVFPEPREPRIFALNFVAYISIAELLSNTSTLVKYLLSVSQAEMVFGILRFSALQSINRSKFKLTPAYMTFD
jgi:hypothetical protein